ncbi:type II secretion system F family protein [Chitinasiproducens palmae]|uniref:Type II secretory pathway, component PulF n=1 Tax=Chitinasiproducens palmae TaxID=1770053 RepID=A0A1H2PKL8_9BURK|nr:type II secretion system F family protein [Chitinasiproducens palmae]SDV46551.1 Type II secretory pathway, component PulF [Chitinasiproducens palmae]
MIDLRKWFRLSPRRAAVTGPDGAATKRSQVSGLERRFVRIQFTTAQRMRLYEKLARFVANGVPLTHALDELYLHVSFEGRKPKTSSAVAVDSWRSALRNGQTLSQSLQGWAPTMERSLVQAGEMSGRLDKALEDVLFLNTASKQIRSALGGLLYPLVLLSCTVFFMWIFGTQVVPVFAQILPVDRWEGNAATLAGLARFVNGGLWPTLAAVIALLCFALASLPRWTGPLRRHLERFPPWSVYRTAAGCGFMASLSALLHAGVPAPTALKLMYQNANPWYAQRVAAIRRALLNGANDVGDAMYRAGYDFPSRDMVMDIRAYAALDGFEEMLEKLSRQWLSESVRAIQSQTAAMRTGAIILMAGVFGWIISSMFELQQQVSAAAT